MIVAIRLLTLITFTAHAVLGCCVSHGSCFGGSTETSAIAGCDHPSHGNGHAEHEQHGASDCKVQVQAAAGHLHVGGEEQSTNQRHRHHCGGIHCVFGVSHHSGNTVSSLRGSTVLWCGHPVEKYSLGISCGGSCDPHRDRLPPSLGHRALRQVWLI